ncbi:hypothetical protein [Steroidobacter cummioxidans]|uniref:hypothetical protein n=1 Tax=Steroidobacter cummioxidans TaxID=1803913 RepID=UPI0012903C83|nr:hypothetical protein [Steroidobacter cummioxidans]
MLKAALLKVVHGFLVGLGFAVSLGLLFFAYGTWEARKFAEQSAEFREDINGSLPAFKKYTADAGFS